MNYPVPDRSGFAEQGFHRRVLGHDPRARHGRDRKVLEERAGRQPEALEFGAGPGIGLGKERKGFGCHYGFLQEHDLVVGTVLMP